MEKSKNITSITTILLLAFSLLASSTLLAALLAVGLPASVAEAKPASVLLQEGLYAEEIEGDLDAASKIYEQIAADKSVDSRYAAQAMYRLGVCYQKKHDHQKAKATFEKLIARFPKQKAIIEKVQPLLAQMSTQNPAVLMPPETLVYLEIGSPGKQIETILNMLKGTPFANPLAAINPGQKSRGTKSPGDILAALMNPSMMAEFKKIRGMAIGFQGVSDNNPPLVAVLYPGESDALRGMIIAGLGMALQPGEAIEGMQTLRMGEIGGVAYDDNVIILALPIKRLAWCVKQYEGITNEPTLASQNKAFQKLSRKVREQNAVTIWADVNKVFPSIKEGMPDEQRLLIEGIGDIGNVDDFTVRLSIEESGLAVETNIGFKDGHNCLAYNLIRTPNLTKAGFEAVPPQAVGVVSFALGESEGAGVAGVRKAVKKLTGLDVGRELFANIEQITLFALPPSPASSKNVLAKNISPIVPCLGLAVTSHNPQKTHRLFMQLLTMADMIGSMNEKSEEHISPTPGKYKIGMFDDEPAYCYVGQAGKSTILTLSPEVLQASLSSLKSGKSALSAEPLQKVLSQLPSDASKLAVVNAGGAIRLADTHICKSLGVQADPNRNSLSRLFGQLAQACGKTTVQVRTNEKPNDFNLNVGINNIPQLGPIFPLLAQIPAAMENPMLCATRPKPADNAVVKPDVALKLSWAPGTGATAHKVYFGAGIDKLSLLDEVRTPSYDKLPTLERGITYYWHVDEVRADGSIVTGDIWSFSTGKLVAWWKFDETSGAKVADSAGSGYDGTVVHGKPVWDPDGKSGGCLDFNERYGISIPKAVFSSIDKAITISVWVNGDKDQEPHSNVIVQAGAGRRGRPYIVTVQTDWQDGGEARFITGSDDRDRVTFNAALDEWAGGWNHYAFVKDADEGFQRIYLNGSLVAEQTGTTASMAGVDAARIGIAPDRFGDQYIGKLDDLRIYNYAFSAEEIRQLCGISPEFEPAQVTVLTPPAAGFGPVADVVIADIGDPSKAALYDFDARRLVRIPDPLRNAGSEERHGWIAREGLDVGATFAGEEYGLIAVDVVATRIASERWDKITPAKLRQALAAEPIGVEKGDWGQAVMPAKGEYPPTFAFRTREGGAGVLQIIDADRSKKTIRFRYKMLRPEVGKPLVKLELAKPVYEWWRAEPKVTKTIYENSQLEIEWDVDPEMGKNILSFGGGVLPIEGDISDIKGHLWWVNHLAFTVRSTPYGKNWDITEGPKPLKSGEYKIYICAFKSKEHFAWRDMLRSYLVGAGTAKLVVKPRPFTGAAAVDVVKREVFLPDADTPGVNVILDLASGELLPAGEGVHQLTVFREMGRGDLAYDRALICLRGGKAKLLRAGKVTGLNIKGQVEDSTAYELPGLPCSLVITTAEGDNYEVTVMSADNNGANLEYKKMLAEPAPGAPVAGFGPVAEVELNDIDESPQAALIDFDTGKLVKIPDRLRKAGEDEAFPWVARRGLDVGAEFAGDEFGLFGIDVVATRIASERWDKITPVELHKGLAAEPMGVERDERATMMLAKGEYLPTFAFRTREGGTGLLQIVAADRSKKTIHFRYKMLQKESAGRIVFLPDADDVIQQGKVAVVLDLTTGKMLPGNKDKQYFNKLNKGDVAYFDDEGKDLLVCFRGAKITRKTANGKYYDTPDQSHTDNTVHIYIIKKTPAEWTITTKEGDIYELKVLSLDNNLAKIKYRKMSGSSNTKRVNLISVNKQDK